MEEIQQKFEHLISEGSNLDYDNIIVPLCNELEDKIGHDTTTWPIVYMQDRVVIYYELLYRNRNKLNEDQELLLMTYRPLIYYIKMLHMTYDEANTWRKDIKKRIPEVFGNGFAGERLVQFQELMKLSKKKLDMSPITYFHYFIGFKFSNKYIGLTSTELKELCGETNIIYINISCGQKHDVYTYRQVTERMGFKLLTEETAKNFNPIIITPLKDYPKEMITGSVADSNYIAINYDNTHYTLLSNGDEMLALDKATTQRFIDGALPVTINDAEYETYAKLMYHNAIPKIVAPVEIDAKLPDAAKIYNDYIRSLIDKYGDMNQNTYREFVRDVADAIPSDVMDTNDKKLFIFYLDTYTFLEFNMYEFVSYLWGYFDPNALI